MNTFRRLSFFVICLIMTTVSNAYDAKVDGIYYNLSRTEKTAYVTSYVRYDPIAHYNGGYSGTVIIPESITFGGTVYSVTAIDYDAFWNCRGLTSVTIPNSVTSIGQGAFDGCI